MNDLLELVPRSHLTNQVCRLDYLGGKGCKGNLTPKYPLASEV